MTTTSIGFALRHYQTNGINDIANKYGAGIRRQIFQLATGGGKTVTFGGLTHRFLSRIDRKVVVLVHRDELLHQANKTIHKGFGIQCDTLTAGKKSLNPNAKVFIGMVETAHKRLMKNKRFFGDVGLLIIDECHIGNFKKIYDYFPNALIVGFSATPESSSKKDPIKNYFDDITVGPNIQGLIEMGALCPNETIVMRGVKRTDLKIKNGEFDSRQMGETYSKSKNIQNAVTAYEMHCLGQKTLIFNCNVEHSKLVTEAFRAKGYPCMHLDGTEPKEERTRKLSWYEKTPNAILCNIGVLTTGFDEPSIMNIMVNRSTLSLALWLQMTGRGSRPYDGKSLFRIIDLGGNYDYHGDWSMDRDWSDMFFNPDKPRDGTGEAPVKNCKKCDEVIAMQAIVCKHCGFVHERKISYDEIAPEFEKVVQQIDIDEIIMKTSGQKGMAAFFQILIKAVTILKYKTEPEEITIDIQERAYLQFESKVRQWCAKVEKPFNRWLQGFAKKQFIDKVNEINKKRR